MEASRAIENQKMSQSTKESSSSIGQAEMFQMRKWIVGMVEELKIKRRGVVEAEARAEGLVEQLHSLQVLKETEQQKARQREDQLERSIATLKQQYEEKTRAVDAEQLQQKSQCESTTYVQDKMREEMKQLKMSIHQREKQVRDLEAQLHTEKAASHKLMSQWREAEGRFGELTQVYQICKQSLTRLEEGVAKAVDLNRKLSQKNDLHACAMREKSNEVEELQAQLVKARVQISERHIDMIKSQQAQVEIETLETRFKQLEEENEKLEKQLEKDWERRKKALSELETAHILVRQHLENANKNRGEADRAREQCQELIGQLDHMTQQLADVEGQLERKQQELGTAREQWNAQKLELEEDVSVKTAAVETLQRDKNDLEEQKTQMVSEAQALRSDLLDAKAKLDVSRCDMSLQAGCSLEALTHATVQASTDHHAALTQTDPPPAVQPASCQTPVRRLLTCASQTDHREGVTSRGDQTLSPAVINTASGPSAAELAGLSKNKGVQTSIVVSKGMFSSTSTTRPASCVPSSNRLPNGRGDISFCNSASLGKHNIGTSGDVLETNREIAKGYPMKPGTVVSREGGIQSTKHNTHYHTTPNSKYSVPTVTESLQPRQGFVKTSSFEKTSDIPVTSIWHQVSEPHLEMTDAQGDAAIEEIVSPEVPPVPSTNYVIPRSPIKCEVEVDTDKAKPASDSTFHQRAHESTRNRGKLDARKQSRDKELKGLTATAKEDDPGSGSTLLSSSIHSGTLARGVPRYPDLLYATPVASEEGVSPSRSRSYPSLQTHLPEAAKATYEERDGTSEQTPDSLAQARTASKNGVNLYEADLTLIQKSRWDVYSKTESPVLLMRQRSDVTLSKQTSSDLKNVTAKYPGNGEMLQMNVLPHPERTKIFTNQDKIPDPPELGCKTLTQAVLDHPLNSKRVKQEPEDQPGNCDVQASQAVTTDSSEGDTQRASTDTPTTLKSHKDVSPGEPRPLKNIQAKLEVSTCNYSSEEMKVLSSKKAVSSLSLCRDKTASGVSTNTSTLANIDSGANRASSAGPGGRERKKMDQVDKLPPTAYRLQQHKFDHYTQQCLQQQQQQQRDCETDQTSRQEEINHPPSDTSKSLKEMENKTIDPGTESKPVTTSTTINTMITAGTTTTSSNSNTTKSIFRSSSTRPSLQETISAFTASPSSRHLLGAPISKQRKPVSDFKSNGFSHQSSKGGKSLSDDSKADGTPRRIQAKSLGECHSHSGGRRSAHRKHQDKKWSPLFAPNITKLCGYSIGRIGDSSSLNIVPKGILKEPQTKETKIKATKSVHFPEQLEIHMKGLTQESQESQVTSPIQQPGSDNQMASGNRVSFSTKVSEVNTESKDVVEKESGSDSPQKATENPPSSAYGDNKAAGQTTSVAVTISDGGKLERCVEFQSETKCPEALTSTNNSLPSGQSERTRVDTNQPPTTRLHGASGAKGTKGLSSLPLSEGLVSQHHTWEKTQEYPQYNDQGIQKDAMGSVPSSEANASLKKDPNADLEQSNQRSESDHSPCEGHAVAMKEDKKDVISEDRDCYSIGHLVSERRPGVTCTVVPETPNLNLLTQQSSCLADRRATEVTKGDEITSHASLSPPDSKKRKMHWL